MGTALKGTAGKSTLQRNSNIELLRIFVMVMIVFHHFAVHGGFSFTLVEVSVSWLWVFFLSASGKMAVNVFVLISGYFLVYNKEHLFDLRQLLKLWTQIAFYSVGIYLVFVIIGREAFSLKTMIKSFLPICTSSWWFASTYFILYLLHPFLNHMLLAMDKSAFKCYLILMIVCWSLVPTVAIYSLQLNKLLWFMCLYSIGAYIRIFGLNPALKRRHYIAICISLFVLVLLASLLIRFLSLKFSFLLSFVDHLYMAENSLPILFMSICLFMIFVKTDIRRSVIINIIASASFGVYLIHENYLVRTFLWVDLFRNAEHQDSPYLILYSIAAVFSVYVVCTFIDLLRKELLEKLFMRIVDKYVDTFTHLAKNFFIKTSNVFFGKVDG